MSQLELELSPTVTLHVAPAWQAKQLAAEADKGTHIHRRKFQSTPAFRWTLSKPTFSSSFVRDANTWAE